MDFLALTQRSEKWDDLDASLKLDELDNNGMWGKGNSVEQTPTWRKRSRMPLLTTYSCPYLSGHELNIRE